MHLVAHVPIETFVLSQIGKWYTEILQEAEADLDPDTRIHGEWLRDEIGKKLRNHTRGLH